MVIVVNVDVGKRYHLLGRCQPWVQQTKTYSAGGSGKICEWQGCLPLSTDWERKISLLCTAVLDGAPGSLRRSSPLDRQVSISVVSPLIALVKDQVETFTLKGLSCFYANSSDQEAKHSVLAGECQLLYISPETLLTLGGVLERR